MGVRTVAKPLVGHQGSQSSPLNFRTTERAQRRSDRLVNANAPSPGRANQPSRSPTSRYSRLAGCVGCNSSRIWSVASSLQPHAPMWPPEAGLTTGFVLRTASTPRHVSTNPLRELTALWQSGHMKRYTSQVPSWQTQIPRMQPGPYTFR
jgi:hypothetical protein